MSNLSTMVWAKKFKLNEPISIKEGTFKKDGAKTLLSERLIPRQYVEDRNSHSNNEHYVIDEEKTAKLMKQREANIVKNEEDAKRANLTTGDLVDAIVGKREANAPTPTPAPPKETPKKKGEEVPAKVEGTTGTPPEGTTETPKEPATNFEDMDAKELHQYCLNNQIKVHHKAGKDKLIEAINKSN